MITMSRTGNYLIKKSQRNKTLPKEWGLTCGGGYWVTAAKVRTDGTITVEWSQLQGPNIALHAKRLTWHAWRKLRCNFLQGEVVRITKHPHIPYQGEWRD